VNSDKLTIDRDMLSLWVWRSVWICLVALVLAAGSGAAVGYVAGLHYGEQCDRG